MDWKQKLIIATSAFAPMPVANAADINTFVCARRTPPVQRHSTVPFMVDLGAEKLFVVVRMPGVAEDRENVEPKLCTEFTVETTVVNAESGAELKKVTRATPLGGGTIIDIDLQEMYGTPAVSADVVVRPDSSQSNGACTSSEALVSFTINGLGGQTFVPSKDRKTGQKIPAHFIKEVTAEQAQ